LPPSLILVLEISASKTFFLHPQPAFLPISCSQRGQSTIASPPRFFIARFFSFMRPIQIDSPFLLLIKRLFSEIFEGLFPRPALFENLSGLLFLQFFCPFLFLPQRQAAPDSQSALQLIFPTRIVFFDTFGRIAFELSPPEKVFALDLLPSSCVLIDGQSVSHRK